MTTPGSMMDWMSNGANDLFSSPDSPLMPILKVMHDQYENAGQQDPTISPAGNLLKVLQDAPLSAYKGLKGLTDMGADAAGKFLFTPMNQQVTPAAGSPGGAPVPDSPMALAQALLDNGQGGKSRSYPIGQAPQIPEPPQYQMAPHAEDPMLKQVSDQLLADTAAPTAPDKTKQDQNAWLSVLSGAASGMAQNSQAPLAQMLLGAGGGAATGAMNANNQNSAEDRKFKEAQLDYLKVKSGVALHRDSTDYERQKLAADIAYRNNSTKWKYQVDMLEQNRPKFLGVKNGFMMFQTVDPQGNMSVQTTPLGMLSGIRGQRQAAGALSGGNDALGDELVFEQNNSPIGVLGMVADDIEGQLPNIIGDKAADEVNKTAMKQVAGTGLTGKEYASAYRQAKMATITGMLMNNPNLLHTAAKIGSPTARKMFAAKYAPDQMQDQTQHNLVNQLLLQKATGVDTLFDGGAQ